MTLPADPTWAPAERPVRPLASILLAPTPPGWLAQARAHPAAVLADHAHCERKAAGQAMALIAAYPQHSWLVAPMVALAQEELRHLAQVLAHLRRAGAAWGPDAGDPYAQGLHALVRRGRDGEAAAHRCLDRLLVAALIEARSCERLGLLADALAGQPLADFYDRLAAAEAGHHRLFLRLALNLASPPQLSARLAQLAERERVLNEMAVAQPRIH